MIKELIIEKYDEMSKTQKQIANYILQNISSVPFYSIQKLAKEVGTSEASIIRFCTFLGFKGFPGFKSELQKLAQEQMSMKERLEISYKAFDEKENGIAEIFREDMNRIERTLEQLNMDDFFKVCDEIILARKIYIIAARSAMALGQFFQYYLNMTLGNVELLTDMNCDTDVLSSLGREDLVIAITFKRYSRVTIDMFRYAAEKGAVTVAITDSPVSPIIKPAKYHIMAETSMPTYIDSFVAPLTVINAILTQIGRNKNIELEHRLQELDDLYKHFKVFE